MNSVNLVGRLARDPEARTFDATGSKKVSFGIILNEGTKEKPVSHFIECEAWNKTGEIVESYFQKGDLIAVSGNLKVDSWENQEGEKRHKTLVRVNSITFLKNKSKPAQEEYPDEKDNNYLGDEDDDLGPVSDDIPF